MTDVSMKEQPLPSYLTAAAAFCVLDTDVDLTENILLFFGGYIDTRREKCRIKRINALIWKNIPVENIQYNQILLLTESETYASLSIGKT